MLQDRQFLQIGLNAYVPAMGYSAGAIHGVPFRAYIGVPATAAPAAVGSLISAQGAAGPITYFTTPFVVDGRYGRTLTYTPSGVPGNNNVIDIIGADYLGQPLVERITGAAAAATLIAGLKAFKWVYGTRINLAATNAITFSLGTGLSLGLPWKGNILAAMEGATNMTFAQINTNFVVPVLTDPQTAITGDPRGTYTPTTAPNGVLAYMVSLAGDPSVNASGNGGLLGIRQFGT